MARPSKLSSQLTGAYTKENLEGRKEAEESLNDLTPLNSEPPEWLDAIAKKEYRRVYPLLKELPTAALDFGLVSAYCQAYSDYARATERLSNEDSIIETERGTKLNQNHTIKRDALNQLNSLAPKIGMSIDSRLKIFTPKKKDNNDDPLGDMLND